MPLETLIDQYCDVWCEPDAARRAELLRAVWASGATYTDPTVHQLNEGELLAHIAKVQAMRPGATVRRTTVVDEHHGVARFGFEVRASDGNVLRHGTDVVFLDAAHAHIEKVIGFFGTLAVSDRSAP